MALSQKLDLSGDDSMGYIPDDDDAKDIPPEGRRPYGVGKTGETTGRRPERQPRVRYLEGESPGRRFMTRLARHETLSAEEEVDLVRRYQENGDTQAREELLLRYQKLVMKLVSMFTKRCGMAWFDDLVGEGNLGLMRALEKFDLSKGKRLKTYASFWIKAFIISHLRKNDQPVYILTTRGKRRAFSNLSKTRERLAKELGREPTHAEIAEAIGGVTEEDVECAIVAGVPARSLDQPVGDSGDATFGDFIPDQDTIDPVISMARDALTVEIEGCLSELTTVQEQVIRMRFGFKPYEKGHSLEEVGEAIGFTREWARQVQITAIRRLTNFSQAERLREYLEK